MRKTTQFQKRLHSGKISVASGVFYGLFEMGYASGGAISSSASLFPDLGFLNFTEIIERLVQIVEAVSLPCYFGR